MGKLQANFRAFYRLLIFIVFVLLYLTVSLFIHLVTRNPDLRRRRFSKHGHFWCKVCLKVFRITVLVKNKPPADRPGLLVGNHLGFIDILACASIQPNLFVTSQEMRETPVLGLITEMGGCIYVERRNRSNIMNELAQMIECLRKGFRIVLYPEAASTDGEKILPFKRTLMTAAAHAGVPIVPYVFNFREINGEPGFKLKYRDSVCWYGDMSFFTALWNAFSLKSLVCEVEFLSPVYTKTEDDRAAVADAIRDMIVAKFDPVEKTESF